MHIKRSGLSTEKITLQAPNLNIAVNMQKLALGKKRKNPQQGRPGTIGYLKKSVADRMGYDLLNDNAAL